ncbi:DUF2510 domain-containing protein [Actinomadura bangladeshensis]|uniref:DUF2510 domain-containing protein n=1 Tax=Actinomadura bangladeshensis TaxID=453573 RepID=A0A6L9Q9H9_9ACTN|nr:DUF2510 domain-containing protein [Actinomadura bangladeshensis]
MSQPGWYPDPYGTGSLRWWDGRIWTERLNPEPDRPPRLHPPRPAREPAREEAPTSYSTPYAAPHAQRPTWERAPSVPALDVNVHGLNLYADDQLVAYGDASLTWPRVEWVAYWAAERPAGSGHRTGAQQWIFQAGRFPFRGGPRVEVVIEPDAVPGVDGEPEHVWGRLIQLCQEHAERRLVAELAQHVRAGESVDVAQGLTVHPGGVRGNRVSLSWSSISGATVDRGRVWIQQAASSSPILYVPQQNPNAVLIPALLALLKH